MTCFLQGTDILNTLSCLPSLIVVTHTHTNTQIVLKRAKFILLIFRRLFTAGFINNDIVYLLLYFIFILSLATITKDTNRNEPVTIDRCPNFYFLQGRKELKIMSLTDKQ